MNYTIDLSKEWDYENGVYLTCETNRIGKFINHYEIYKKILDLPGDILEFGVYKGASFVRLLSFRDLLECSGSRKVIGFDAFGKFPDQLKLESDKEFVKEFENEGGDGISKKEFQQLLERKGFQNFSLIEGDILKTLPLYIKNNPSLKISILHIDVDVYEPTKIILENLWDKIVPDGILILDDYGIIEGETKAVDEFFASQHIHLHKPPYYNIPVYITKPTT